jgi:opacity protein-like surface antigen
MTRNGIRCPKIACSALLWASALIATRGYAGNAYIVLSGGVARANFAVDASRGGQAHAAFRIASGVDVAPSWAVEVGIARAAQRFTPPQSIAAVDTRARINVTTLDIVLVARYAPTDRCRLFVTAGPALASTRAEISVNRGSATALDSTRAVVLRASVGVEFAVSDRQAIQVSVAHLAPVGQNSGSSITGKSAVDSVLIGVLVHF